MRTSRYDFCSFACLILAFGIVVLAARFRLLAEDSPLPTGWKRLTHDRHYKQRPVWSPDGTRLLFTRQIDNEISVIECDADGSNERRLLESPHPRQDAVYLPDGKRIAFTFDKISPGQGDMELYLADRNGENQQPLFITEGRLSHEEWASPSSDGNWIACTSTRNDNSELYLVKVDGTEKVRLTSDPALDVHPAFSRTDARSRLPRIAGEIWKLPSSIVKHR